jgi:hypothetical protein
MMNIPFPAAAPEARGSKRVAGCWWLEDKGAVFYRPFSRQQDQQVPIQDLLVHLASRPRGEQQLPLAGRPGPLPAGRQRYREHVDNVMNRNAPAL